MSLDFFVIQLGKRARQKLKAAQKQRVQEQKEEENLSAGHKKRLEKNKQAELARKNQEFKNFQSVRGSSHTERILKKRAEERAENAGRSAMVKGERQRNNTFSKALGRCMPQNVFPGRRFSTARLVISVY